MLGLSVLGLLNFPFGPFGTVLAIYGLWVPLARDRAVLHLNGTDRRAVISRRQRREQLG